MAPIDTSRTAAHQFPCPASGFLDERAVQLGGGGMNGYIPNLTGGEAAMRCYNGVRHLRQRLRTPASLRSPRRRCQLGQSGDDWTLSDEAIKNLGYMQLKKTHDAAMVLMERMYGERPRSITSSGLLKADAKR